MLRKNLKDYLTFKIFFLKKDIRRKLTKRNSFRSFYFLFNKIIFFTVILFYLQNRSNNGFFSLSFLHTENYLTFSGKHFPHSTIVVGISALFDKLSKKIQDWL